MGWSAHVDEEGVMYGPRRIALLSHKPETDGSRLRCIDDAVTFLWAASSYRPRLFQVLQFNEMKEVPWLSLRLLVCLEVNRSIMNASDEQVFTMVVTPVNS